MTLTDIIILIAAIAIVGGFVGISIWRKKTGRSKGCGCDCDCSSCSLCALEKKEK